MHKQNLIHWWYLNYSCWTVWSGNSGIKETLKVKIFFPKKKEINTHKKKKLVEKMNTSSSSGGLVRRTNAAKSTELSSNASTNNDLNDNFKNGSDEENPEETSDKETRLTLMEEVLLLGLKDKEVRMRVWGKQTRFAGSMNRFAMYEKMHTKSTKIREKREVWKMAVRL